MAIERRGPHPSGVLLLATLFLSVAGCGGGGGGGIDASVDSGPEVDSGTHPDGGRVDSGGTVADGGPGADGGTTTADGGPGADGGSAVTCTSPVFMTSDPNGGWTDGDYYVHNNMWNTAAGLGPETLYACSYHNWYVVSNQTNNAGAVKTYPNVHEDYSDVPIASFGSITSRFAATSPHVGIYDVAYDIWTNGVASSGSTEIMIWTENFHQVPAGDMVTTVTFGGRTYDVWKTPDNGYIAFVPTVPFTSGSLDLLEIFDWTMTQGWLRTDSTLGQIDFGVEIVDTGGSDATFSFTDFAITST